MHTKIKTLVPALLGATALLGIAPVGTALAQTAIVPMGDSITAGTRGQCGYRRIMTQNMLNNPSCNVDFVGPNTTSTSDISEANCEAIDTDHFSFSGRRADEFTFGRIGVMQDAHSPDVYLVHIGSNDIFQGETVEQIMTDIDLVRSRIFTHSPEAKLLLANVIPWSPVSPDESFGNFDNELVDELAVSAALTAAIDSYVANQNNPNLLLVDVASGFNNNTMTVDGVHPNDLGEAHISSRFEQALQVAGVCDVVELPTLTMEANNWYQISLPANPYSFNKVRDIFDNLPAEGYGTTWRVFGWDPNQSGGERNYTDLGLDGEMEQGRAYWALQAVSLSVEIDMPFGSTLAPLRNSSACTTNVGCFNVKLTPESAPLVDATQGAYDWDLAGYPHFTPSVFSSTRVTTPDTGPCSGELGCTPEEAETNQVMNGTIFRFNNDTNSYDSVEGDAPLAPWDGFWIPVLSQGVNGNSRWVVAPE